MDKMDFLTTYNKDYVEKKTTARIKYTGCYQEFNDPIGEGFKTFLTVEECPEEKLPEENGDHYLKQLAEKYPKVIKVHFEKPINKDVIERDHILAAKSCYQIDYCDLDKDLEYKEEQQRRNNLPPLTDLSNSLTTHKLSYRDPVKLNKNALNVEKPVIKPTTLGCEEHIRKLLKITLGESEYQDVIGRVGQAVIDDALHGEIKHEPCTLLLDK